YWLLDGVDTVGALSVAIDPRESDLRRASAEQLESLWSGAIVAGLDEVGHAFTASGRGDLRPLLLVIALLLLIGESALARGTRVGQPSSARSTSQHPASAARSGTVRTLLLIAMIEAAPSGLCGRRESEIPHRYPS